MTFTRRRIAGAAIGLAVAGTGVGVALASPPSNIASSFPVPKADLIKRINVRSDGIQLKTKAPTDVAVQTVTFQPGGFTGWHHHPGMTVVAVQSGAVTVVDSKCRATTYGPGMADGAVFTESGNRPVDVRNTGSAPATVYAMLIAPDADPPLFRVEHAARSCP